MSINTILFDSTGGPSLFHQEKIVQKYLNVRLQLESGGGYPGMGGSYHAPKGQVYLTNMRIVYVVFPTMEHFKSVEIPLGNCREIKLVQPFFGANEIHVLLAPIPGRGLVGNAASLILTFKDGGAAEFLTFYRHAVDSARAYHGPPPTEEQLPEYTEVASNDHTVILNSSNQNTLERQ